MESGGMIVRTRGEWAEVVRKLRESRDKDGIRCFSYDTETDDKGYPDIHIVGFSVAWYEPPRHGIYEKRGAYIPVGHKTGELQLALQDVQDDLAALLEDDEIEHVMQNAKYDVEISTLFPRRVRCSQNIFDTMVASWLVNTNGVGTYMQVLSGNGEHGLKALSLYLLKRKMTELSDLAPKRKYMKDGVEMEFMEVSCVPVEKLGAYAGDDAVNTLDLRDYFKPILMEDERVYRGFQLIEREFVFCLAELEMFGVELEVPILVGMRERVEKEIAQIEERMYSLRPGQDFDRLVDPQLLVHCIDQWNELERRFALPKDHVEYPKKAVTKGPKNAKVTTFEPAAKATLRKQLLQTHDLLGHPVEEKIRDEKLRAKLRRFPHLAHKVFKLGSDQMLNLVLFEECGIEPIGGQG
jgi:DNA polymerase I-like protein with 3'-5' exonuclease and polymerase domains